MASLAGMLKERGYLVTGSDQNIYPPMSSFLEELGIPVKKGYHPENLHPNPDLVIVGNVITKMHTEAIELGELGLPYLSFPQALRAFAMAGKRSIVISGTHGKTTTASLAAWILEKAGKDPGFMIGGIPGNFNSGFKLSDGELFVIEGDEYDTAFFDKGPKFLHYQPWVTILTSIEFDHADIYRDLEHVIESFRKLIDLIPEAGLLIANGDDPLVLHEVKRAKCPVVTYSVNDNGLWTATRIRQQSGNTELTVLKDHNPHMQLTTPFYGRHNIANLLATVAVADFLDIPHPAVREAVKEFKGVKRRQEMVGEREGVMILDDFAHHPTAVRETLTAVKERYKERRLVAVFEPRSNSSRRNVFQERYAQAFDLADLVFFAEPTALEKIPASERFSSRRLAEDLSQRGVHAFSFAHTDTLLESICDQIQPGDVVLFMSNGSFDNLPRRLLQKVSGGNTDR
jgi:UDP-N-acetylmuramate: L-alanyl-gamma-D-glutamyl-meso-diaminopimelate ligase